MRILVESRKRRKIDTMRILATPKKPSPTARRAKPWVMGIGTVRLAIECREREPSARLGLQLVFVWAYRQTAPLLHHFHTLESCSFDQLPEHGFGRADDFLSLLNVHREQASSFEEFVDGKANGREDGCADRLVREEKEGDGRTGCSRLRQPVVQEWLSWAMPESAIEL